MVLQGYCQGEGWYSGYHGELAKLHAKGVGLIPARPCYSDSFCQKKKGQKNASRESFFFFFPNFIFHKLECTGGKSKKKKKKKIPFENRDKKSSGRPFLAHPAGGQETIFYFRMALVMTVCPDIARKDVIC